MVSVTFLVVRTKHSRHCQTIRKHPETYYFYIFTIKENSKSAHQFQIAGKQLKEFKTRQTIKHHHN